MREARPFLAALAVIQLVAELTFVAGPPMFICRGDSVARQQCCCFRADRMISPPLRETAKLSQACCCDVSLIKTSTTPSLASSREDGPTPWKTSHVGLASEVSGSFQYPAAPAADRSARPPPAAITVLLQKQSLLI